MLPPVPTLEDKPFDFRRILHVDETVGGTYATILKANVQFLNEWVDKGEITVADRTAIMGSMLPVALQSAINFELEASKNANQAVLAQEQIYATRAQTFASIIDAKMKVMLAHLQARKLELEILVAREQRKLNREQGKAFRYNHMHKMIQLIFDMVTIGVTQDEMQNFQQQNKILETLIPEIEWRKAMAWEEYKDDDGNCFTDPTNP